MTDATRTFFFSIMVIACRLLCFYRWFVRGLIVKGPSSQDEARGPPTVTLRVNVSGRVGGARQDTWEGFVLGTAWGRTWNEQREGWVLILHARDQLWGQERKRSYRKQCGKGKKQKSESNVEINTGIEKVSKADTWMKAKKKIKIKEQSRWTKIY